MVVRPAQPPDRGVQHSAHRLACWLLVAVDRQRAMVMPNDSNKFNEVYLTEQRVAEQFQIGRCTNWKRAVIVARLGVGSSIH